MITKILAALKDGVVGLGKRLVGLISQDAWAEGIRQKWVSPLPEKAVFLTNCVASDLLKWLTVAGFPPPANPMVPLFMASAARHFCCRGVFFFLASLTPGGAAAVVIDTFDEGPFHETTDQSAGLAFYQHGSMLGGLRVVRISTDRRTTVVSSSIVTGSSVLEFDTGEGLWNNGLSTGRITLTWSVDEAVDLLGYDAFRFSFSMLTGQGRVHVGVDDGGGGSGDTTVPLWNPGELLVPFADVDFGSEDISSGSYFQVSISGVSKDFAFSLDEISIVPEPGVGLLLVTAGWMFHGRRRRSGGKLAR